MERISNYQLFSLTMLFQIGTTIIFAFASAAGRDAWIAILLSTAIGTLIVWGNVTLMRLNPGLTLVEWFPNQWGRWIGTPIAWLYPFLFMYSAGRIVADLTFLIPSTLLPRTPPLFLLIIFITLVAYGVYHGIEVLCRLGGLLLPCIFILFILETILLFLDTDMYNLKNILPIAGEGFELIWRFVWPTGITQSFGEILSFGMIWPLVNQSNRILRTTLLATILTGLFLAVANVLAVVVMGETIFKRAYFPLYLLLTQISLAEFLENLDVFGVIYFFVTAFFKISLYIFAAVRGIQLLTMQATNRRIIIPVCIAVLFVGMTMADNIMEHIMGVHMKILSPYLWIPLLLVIPSLLLVTALIRKGLAKS